MGSIPDDAARPERVPNARDEELARADSLRPGDLLYIPDATRWEVVTYAAVGERSDPPRFEIHTAAPHSGSAWMFDPADEVRVRRGDLRHPAWCDLEDCDALNPVWPCHRSPLVVAMTDGIGGWDVSAQLWKAADEPLEAPTASLVVRVDERTTHLPAARFAIELESVQGVALYDALRPLVDVLRGQLDARSAS